MLVLRSDMVSIKGRVALDKGIYRATWSGYVVSEIEGQDAAMELSSAIGVRKPCTEAYLVVVDGRGWVMAKAEGVP